jgi:hypothetical protein
VVVAIIFSPNDCGLVIVTMMKSNNAAVVLIPELPRSVIKSSHSCHRNLRTCGNCRCGPSVTHR